MLTHLCISARILFFFFFPTVHTPLHISPFICVADVVSWEICLCITVNCSQGSETADYLIISYMQETDQICHYRFPYLLSQENSISNKDMIFFSLYASPVTLPVV